ncbi:sugar ABC transporter ATP-binding protein [Bacillus sp. HNG]|uniref:sugar ABC transporter ATP-binding protein n=1 Tax=Bacillus sp. HNG TaxID=2293325 RepID=UPI000E2E9D47|nr:sugar ABC transporter ATP-binding protein [Bacillus sp. HNG]RFB17438.1 sugar ABC transporter ATP-binding protein [Bacillus sp. HNG]
MKSEILRLERVTTIKEGNTSLNKFNLHIFKSEIMGLVCLNITGKESLVEVIKQNLPIHYGRVYFNETLVNNYQHSTMTLNAAVEIKENSSLVENLTVKDNIFLLNRRQKKFTEHSWNYNKLLHSYTEELGIEIEGNELVAKLGNFHKLVVELLRAVIMDTKLIVIRDISNLISSVELAKFHDFLRYYTQKGFSFLYICSHHEEAFKICDRMCLMRDGRILKIFDKSEFDNEKISPFYIGEYLHLLELNAGVNLNKNLLSFQNVYTKNLHALNFTIKKGECTVLLDRDNTVLTDIFNLMTGELKLEKGNILLEETTYNVKKKEFAISYGVAFILENPTQTMLFKEMTYLQNLCFMVDKKENPVSLRKNVVRSIIQEYEPIVGEEIYEPNISHISLPSLYNLIYYKIHLCKPKIVFCVQPFAGADMYLRLHVIHLINQLIKKGITVVILAVNIADSLVVADKLIVFEKGRLSSEYTRSEFSKFSSEGISLM